MKEKILFVTKGGENNDDGFAYVVQLAGTLRKGVDVLMVHTSGVIGGFGDMMAAAAFAENGDFQTAKSLAGGREPQQDKTAARSFMDKGAGCSVEVVCEVAHGDIAVAIKEHLRKRQGIEMVLLSPSLSEGRKSFDIRKLVKNISNPVSFITRPARAGA